MLVTTDMYLHQSASRFSQRYKFFKPRLSYFLRTWEYAKQLDVGLNTGNPQHLLNLVCRTPKRHKQARTKEDLNAWQLASTWEQDTPVYRHTWLMPPSIMFTKILYFTKKSVKIFGLILFISTGVQSNISSDLMNFFKQSGAVGNSTSPGVHQDQAAGYYTGGGFTVRTGSRTVQPATVQMPGFRAGCGGIDAWLGGFSHIRESQIVDALRNIGASTASYAFMLAVQTVSPQIYNIMNELNALATKINQTNINSCEAAATLLGGVWPKTDQSSQHLCRAIASNLGGLSDWARARQECGAKGERGRILNNRSGVYKDMLVGEFNLAWKAIGQNAFLRSDSELAHLFLTLTGSIIVKLNGDSYVVTVLPSHADRDDLLNGLLNGGATSIYTCDSEACLNPTLKATAISEGSSLLRKVRIILDSLVDKIYKDEDLSDEEKGFLNATRLPIYKMLNVLTAYRRGHAPLDVQQYAEIIAVDILYTYVLEIIDIVHESVVQLRSVQVDEEHIRRFLEQLRHARSRILERRRSSFESMDQALSMIESTQLIEKQLHVMMGRLA